MSASGKRKWSASEKLRIVLEGMNPAVSVADLCRREGVPPNLFYLWKKQLLGAAGKIFDAKSVSGRPNPASDGRLKTSHFEERQIESLLSWMRSASMEVGDGESAQSGHGRDDSVPSPAWLVRSSDCT